MPPGQEAHHASDVSQARATRPTPALRNSLIEINSMINSMRYPENKKKVYFLSLNSTFVSQLSRKCTRTNAQAPLQRNTKAHARAHIHTLKHTHNSGCLARASYHILTVLYANSGQDVGDGLWKLLSGLLPTIKVIDSEVDFFHPLSPQDLSFFPLYAYAHLFSASILIAHYTALLPWPIL